jgi:hypothetical protein
MRKSAALRVVVGFQRYMVMPPRVGIFSGVVTGIGLATIDNFLIAARCPHNVLQ